MRAKQKEHEYDKQDQHDNSEVVKFSKRTNFRKLMDKNKVESLQSLFIQEGVDFNNPELNLIYLPLQHYDDYTHETIFVDDIINFDEVFSQEGKSIDAYS